MLLTVGHLTRDRYPEGFVPGGGVWYAAHAWRALGHTPRVLTAAALPDVPAERPGDWQVVAGPMTTTFHNTYPEGGERVMRLEAVAPRLLPADLPESWQRAKAVLFAPVAAEMDPVAWLAAIEAPLKAAGLQGWLKVRTPEDHWQPNPRALDPRCLAGLDVATLSDEDYGGDTDWLATLRTAVPLVALTHGPQGCTLLTANGAQAIPAERAREIDPTGAGDTFAAALVAALAAGRAAPEAAAYAARIAARAVERRGPLIGLD